MFKGLFVLLLTRWLKHTKKNLLKSKINQSKSKTYMEAGDGKKVRMGKDKDKKDEGSLPIESQGSEWTPLPNLVPEVTSGLGLKA